MLLFYYLYLFYLFLRLVKLVICAVKLSQRDGNDRWVLFVLDQKRFSPSSVYATLLSAAYQTS